MASEIHSNVHCTTNGYCEFHAEAVASSGILRGEFCFREIVTEENK